MKYESYITEWKKLYEEGMSIRQIALAYDVPSKSVNRTLSGAIEKRPKSPYAKFADEWLKLYQSGYTKTEIASKYKANPSTVGKILEKKGIPISEVESKRKYKYLSKEFVDLYTKGYSLGEISEKYNIDKQTISNYLEREGMDRRSLSESIRVYETNENYFDDIDTKEKAYHLGLLYSVGSLLKQHNGYAVQITTSKNTLYLLYPLLQILRGSNEGIYTNEEDGVSRVRFSSEHLHNHLKQLGFGSKSEMIFPDLDDAFYPAFIQGYFEASATVDSRNDLYISGPIKFTMAIKKILENKANVDTDTIKIYRISENEHRVVIHMNKEVEKITEWLLFNSGIETYKVKVMKP